MYIGCVNNNVTPGSAAITIAGSSVFTHTSGDFQLANCGTATMTLTGNAQFNENTTSGRLYSGDRYCQRPCKPAR